MPGCKPDFSSIRSYEEANEFLAKAKPFPESKGRDETYPRRLEAVRKRHMSIRLLIRHEIEKLYVETFGEGGYYTRQHNETSQAQLRANGEQRHIALQLYSTDVVVWREDNVIILDPYVSNSTNAFVSRCEPEDIRVHYEPRACIVSCFTGKREPHKWSPEDSYPTYDRLYRVASNRRIALKQDGNGFWWPIGAEPDAPRNALGQSQGASGYEPWDTRRIDLKRAKAALREHEWHDFELWAIGYATMTSRPYGNTRTHGNAERFTTKVIMEILRDREQWKRLIDAPSLWPTTPGQRSSGHGFARAHEDNMREAMKNDPLYINKLHARQVAHRVKMAIYEACNCVTICNLDHLKSYSQVTSHFKTKEKYDWRFI